MNTIILTCLSAIWCVSVCAGEIHDAISAGDVEKVRTLLAGNPTLGNEKSDKGAMPLVLAAAEGNKEIIELLLKANAEGKQGALNIACEIGNKDAVELLVNSGAEVNPAHSLPPLWFASGYGGHPEIVKLLLDKSANAKWAAKNGTSLLHNMVNAAVTAPKERTDAGRSWTVKPEDYAEIARLLVAHGADPNARDKQGKTAAVLAQTKGLTKVLDSLTK